MARRTAIAGVGLSLLAALTFATGTHHVGVSRLDAEENQPVPPQRPELSLGRSAEYDYDPPAPGTYRLPALKPAADGVVLDLNGRTGKLREMLQGRITVLSFIYTRCADPRACPYATGVLYKVHSISEQDPVIRENLRLVTFSFDPTYDTPRVLSNYSQALRKDSGSEWLFLTGADNTDLTSVLQAYGQQVDRRKDPTDPLGPYSHLLRVYLIDRQGMIRNIYSSGMLDPRLVLTDVRTLLLEERLLEERLPGKQAGGRGTE